MSFAGKVALVTGAGSGMGRLASQRMSAAGATVVGFDLNEEGLRETGRSCERFVAVPLDVTDERATAEAVAKVERDTGPIARVMNAAAIMPTGLLLDQDARLVNRIMEINYGGTVNVTMAALPAMKARGEGDLVNFASIAGWYPSLHFGAYNASKFAVVAFTEVLAHENRTSGLRFACVCPPPVATPLLDQAKSNPKILEGVPPIEPAQVLDAIERDLARGRLMVFPDRGSRITYTLRRFFPRLMWSLSHRAEGI